VYVCIYIILENSLKFLDVILPVGYELRAAITVLYYSTAAPFQWTVAKFHAKRQPRVKMTRDSPTRKKIVSPSILCRLKEPFEIFYQLENCLGPFLCARIIDRTF